jgi:hypothetical protein
MTADDIRPLKHYIVVDNGAAHPSYTLLKVSIKMQRFGK